MIGEKDKDLERTRSLHEKIYKESEVQKKKFLETTQEQRNKQRLIVERLKIKETKEKDKEGDNFFNDFIEVFCQVPSP